MPNNSNSQSDVDYVDVIQRIVVGMTSDLPTETKEPAGEGKTVPEGKAVSNDRVEHAQTAALVAKLHEHLLLKLVSKIKWLLTGTAFGRVRYRHLRQFPLPAGANNIIIDKFVVDSLCGTYMEYRTEHGIMTKKIEYKAMGVEDLLAMVSHLIEHGDAMRTAMLND